MDYCVAASPAGRACKPRLGTNAGRSPGVGPRAPAVLTPWVLSVAVCAELQRLRVLEAQRGHWPPRQPGGTRRNSFLKRWVFLPLRILPPHRASVKPCSLSGTPVIKQRFYSHDEGAYRDLLLQMYVLLVGRVQRGALYVPVESPLCD